MAPPSPATPSRAELRKLVLNYLCHYSFVDTAKAFSTSVPLQGWYEGEEDGNGPESIRMSDEQVEALDVRRDIRESILSGKIYEARELITAHFPTVLSDDPPLPPPPPAPFIIPQPLPCIPTMPVIPEFPSSLAPQNISLALSIQQWIEALRTVPLPYPAFSASPPAETTVTTAPVPANTEAQDQTALILMGQQLYARARQLNPPFNVQFRDELVNIASLVAYKEPEKAHESVRHHLEWSRRKGVATQVNGAILNSLGYPPYVPLASLIRQLTFVYQMLHELVVRPPDGGYPEGVEILDGGEEDQDWAADAIPEFRLSAYLYKEKKGKGDVDLIYRADEDEDEDMDAEGEEVAEPTATGDDDEGQEGSVDEGEAMETEV
ncbi:hypothetical protein CALCODRAFT_488142 [Calocera cornea HHB12733]|uniref:CRA domain-containing protein n=1 Tax=Calocera cornea HHB12733 TaxID=1353952 RepID=A0A165CPW3_9BASI|nr:hypothetical protein CALCODRAFT_488142 [Calocera cornea HHB12733]